MAQVQQAVAQDPQQGAAAKPTPQEMEIYRKVMLAAMKIIYTAPQPFLDMIRSAPDPTKGILMATNIILQKIRQSIKGIPPQVIDQMAPKAVKLLGPMIGKLLLELASVAGILNGGESAGAPAGAPPTGAAAAPRGLVANAQAQPPAMAGA